MSETSTEPAAAEAPPEVKIKVRKPKQRACDEKNDKGQVCCGHLKRWYDYPAQVATRVGKNVELYRCENCKTLYKPHPAELPRSYTQRY